VEELKRKLRAAEQEIAELDARVGDLQGLWHSKEVEARELLARATRAEQEAAEARAEREQFAARARAELTAYLVGERDAALTRFADLERRLLGPAPKH
jgi:chromosome segregation ATPase